jgi:putative membrane protein
MTTVLIEYGHYLGLAGLFAGLALELVLFRPRVDGATARRLAQVDAVYGLAAVLVLITGLLRLFAGDKPAGYYGVNFIFHIKMTVFVVAVLLSVWPSVKFFGGRRVVDDTEHHYPAAVGVLLRVELALLLLIPLLAVMMSRGFGFRG